jgi:hypothetical protein
MGRTLLATLIYSLPFLVRVFNNISVLLSTRRKRNGKKLKMLILEPQFLLCYTERVSNSGAAEFAPTDRLLLAGQRKLHNA